MIVRRICACGVLALCLPGARADFTRNIMITGYWPPTNDMIRHFSANPQQNPAWEGNNWEGRGYNIYSYFPEFPAGSWPIGVGDFEVDYQDTSADWWRITSEIKPVAIITFSRGDTGKNWELEYRQRNLSYWIADSRAPYYPTPSPPDPAWSPLVPRLSTLPMQNIVNQVNAANLGFSAFIDTNGNGGGYLSEYIAYHGVWYQSLHKDPTDAAWSVAAGHIHVGTDVTSDEGRAAAEISLRALLDYVDTILPEPGTAMMLVVVAGLWPRRR